MSGRRPEGSAGTVSARPARHLRAAALALGTLPLLGAACRDGASAGKLHVVASPNGEVWVDGVGTRRRTPVADLAARPGRHRVEVRLDDGRRTETVTLDVRPGRTHHVVLLPARDRDAADACDSGTHSACWTTVDAALRAGDRATAVDRARRYLVRFPDGAYHRLARAIVAGAQPDRPSP